MGNIVTEVVLLLCCFFNLHSSAVLKFSKTSSCNLPPTNWCDSTEIAEACGVYHQCKDHVWTQYTDAPLVDLTLYYESLCPDCKVFVKEQLYPAYQKVGSIMNLTLVPYGNAQEKKDGDNWVFDCQHGAQECDGNMIETCAMAIVKNITVYMPFIHCIEVSNISPTYPMKDAVEKCAKEFNMPLNEMIQCAMTKQGNLLEHGMAMKTDALSPPHQYVPYVTLNGVHTEKIEREAESDLIGLICDTYKGKKPAGCEMFKDRS